MFVKFRETSSISKNLMKTGSLFSLIFLTCLIVIVPVFGQILNYVPYTQLSLFPFSNPYSINYNGLSSFSLLSPYVAGYNPYLNPTFNALGTLSRTFSYPQLYPQANVNGSLVPFANPVFNPLPLPYNIAASYFAAALIPADVSGTWFGQWASSFLAAGVVVGELSITLAQNGTDVTGTAVFLLNKVLKYGAYVTGTVEGDVLTLNSTIVTSATGTMTFDVTIVATVAGTSMEGTYEVINLATGLISEQGTFTATRL